MNSDLARRAERYQNNPVLMRPLRPFIRLIARTYEYTEAVQ